jgi:pilus assembly protein CpaC
VNVKALLRRPAAFTITRPIVMMLVLLAPAFLPAGAFAEGTMIRFPKAGEVVSLSMTPSKALTVETDVDYSDIVVGDPEIVDAEPLTSRSLYLLARKTGRTNVLFYDTEKRLVGLVDIDVTLDLGDLRSALRSALPNSKLTATLVNGRIRLGGTLPDGLALRTALDIASQFTTDPVINTVRVTDSQQVMLQVRFLEAKRDAGRELGVGWKGGDSSGSGFSLGVAGAGLPSGATPFGTIISRVLDSGMPVDVVVKALESRNLARRLAEPNLIAQSGETASFLAGGEFPVAVPNGNNDGITIQYKEYGVRLTFTPIVLDDGLINLKLEPEVSEIDTTVPVSINGTGVPALITRRTKTTVELHDGQSFAIAGLLQTSNMRVKDQVPWLGQVPILGSLFRSASYQKRETNLVVIVTPHLVRPAQPGEPLHSPLDDTVAANDAEFFLMGKTEVSADAIRRFSNGAGVKGAYGHIIDLTPEPANARN